MTSSLNLQEWFGSIDIYLFDQLLKGRFVPGMRVLDAGCGSGRNLVYFLRSGYDVFGVDGSTEAISQTRQLAAGIAPHLPVDNFHVEKVEQMSFAGGSFDVVLSSAVLHFARNEEQWQAMRQVSAQSQQVDVRRKACDRRDCDTLVQRPHSISTLRLLVL